MHSFLNFHVSVANKTIIVPPPISDSSTSGKKRSVVGPVIGGVIGGLAIVAIIFVAVYFWRHRARHQFPAPTKLRMMEEAGIEEPLTVPYSYDPSTNRSESHHHVPFGQSQPSESSYSVITPIPPPGTGIITSSKEREAYGTYQTHRSLPSIPFSQAGASSIQPPTTRGPTSDASGSSPLVSPSEVAGLRAEVENLRRVMQEIQEDRMEAPPGYHDSQAQNPSQTHLPPGPSQPSHS